MNKITKAITEREEGFDKEFPCIDPNCDNNGVTWEVVAGPYGDPEQERQQCQWCHEHRFPYMHFNHTTITTVLQAAIEALKEKKKEIPDRTPGRSSFDNILRLEKIRMYEGYNQAINDAIALLEEGKK